MCYKNYSYDVNHAFEIVVSVYYYYLSTSQELIHFQNNGGKIKHIKELPKKLTMKT